MTAPSFSTLDEWLDYISHTNSQTISLGLDRMKAVLSRMPWSWEKTTIITVGGTNGKGSSVTMLERIYREAGYKTGLHVSPHLLRFNERCQINGEPVSDRAIVDAFTRVASVVSDTPLTYFEYSLMAFLDIFQREKVDVLILEVGLGGRLDATNALDSQAALVTTIGLDHERFLGSTRDSVGAEKVEIYRPGCVAVCADPEPPVSFVARAQTITEHFVRLGVDFDFVPDGHNPLAQEGTYTSLLRQVRLPRPGLWGEHQWRNAAGVLRVVEGLSSRLPVSDDAIARGLTLASIAGRFQTMAPGWIIDVGHNPHAAHALKEAVALWKTQTGQKVYALCGMLKDKDRQGVMSLLRDTFEGWVLVDLPTDRGGLASDLALHLPPTHVLGCASEMVQALQILTQHGLPNHQATVVIFGSFVTVEEALKATHRFSFFEVQ